MQQAGAEALACLCSCGVFCSDCFRGQEIAALEANALPLLVLALSNQAQSPLADALRISAARALCMLASARSTEALEAGVMPACLRMLQRSAADAQGADVSCALACALLQDPGARARLDPRPRRFAMLQATSCACCKPMYRSALISCACPTYRPRQSGTALWKPS